ncbi:MAG: hypothetical protein ACO3GW_03070 [Vulcanococcus sp.]
MLHGIINRFAKSFAVANRKQFQSEMISLIQRNRESRHWFGKG